jgi:hypothetical protein
VKETGSPPRFFGGRGIGVISEVKASASRAARRSVRQQVRKEAIEKKMCRTFFPSLLTLKSVLVALLASYTVLVGEVLGGAVRIEQGQTARTDRATRKRRRTFPSG